MSFSRIPQPLHPHDDDCPVFIPAGSALLQQGFTADLGSWLRGFDSSSPTSEVGQRCLRARCVSQKRKNNKKSSCSSRRCLMRIGSRLEKFYQHRSGGKQIIFTQQKEESLSNWWKENKLEICLVCVLHGKYNIWLVRLFGSASANSHPPEWHQIKTFFVSR